MLNDWLLILLKFAGSITAATYGVYATLTNFKEEKDGKQVLSRKGYVGIALLIASASLSLSTTAITDYSDKVDRDKRKADDIKQQVIEAKEREDDLKNIKEIVDGLGTVKANLGEARQSLEDSSQVTKGISSNLGIQLRVSDLMSTRLTGAAATLLRTSEVTNTLLRESTENVGFIDVTLEFIIDPAHLKDENGHPMVSRALITALEEGRPDAISNIVKQFKARPSQIRGSVSQGLLMGSYLGKETDKREPFGLFQQYKQADTFSGSDRALVFWIAEKSLSGTSGMITCVLKYRSTPNRFAGIRTFKDLNGLTWGITLNIDPELSNVLKPSVVTLDVGQSYVFQKRRLIILTSGAFSAPELSASGDLKALGDGRFKGELVIPSDFF
jgi:hypothetical protein